MLICCASLACSTGVLCLLKRASSLQKSMASYSWRHQPERHTTWRR
jgi:hypothetical protein